MADRVTLATLESLCATIEHRVNGAAGGPLWTRADDGRSVARIGAYYIDGAYGGVALYRIVTDGGGVSDVLGCGHVPKRELANRMRAFIRGLEVAAGE